MQIHTQVRAQGLRIEKIGLKCGGSFNSSTGEVNIVIELGDASNCEYNGMKLLCELNMHKRLKFKSMSYGSIFDLNK